ncbi:MAG: vWA domain-containing protein [Kofleriaceae bacterium]
MSAPPAECGAACDGATPCSSGFYCTTDGFCTADCSDDVACPNGYECSAEGRCALDCPSVMFTPTRVTPHVELLIDQSGSMNANFNGKTRWAAVRDALVATGGVVEQLESSVVFGATLYTSFDGTAPCPALTSHARAAGNLAGIRTLLDGNTWADETPTGESLAAVAANFPAPADGSPRVIDVATDGEPDTCAVPNPNPTAAAQQASINAAAAAYAAGIQVFILSVGNQVSDAHLQEVANAGVGRPVTTGTAPFYKANNQSELTAAFDAIIGGVVSCELTLDGQITPDAGPRGDVRLGGVQLIYPTDWEIVDANTIRLLGSACTALQTQPNAQLSAEFPCGSVIF